MFGLLSKKKKSASEKEEKKSSLEPISKLVTLIILDGFGISTEKQHNAVIEAKTPFVDTIWTKGKKTLLHASGTPVGLPDGEVGNSEVGHLNIGAGRVVYQSLPLINDSIMDGTFHKHPVLLKAINHAKKKGTKLHIMGILSAGGVHGHISHMFELLEMCKKQDISPYIHAFMDGRDVEPNDGEFYLKKLLDKIEELGIGQISSVVGRFYSMDRDNRWERIQLAYEAMVGKGKRTAVDPMKLVKEAYKNKEDDQIFLPTTMLDDSGNLVGPIEDGDACIIYNYREDRSREIIKVFVQEKFPHFKRSHNPENLHFCTMMGYGEGLKMDVVFPPKNLENTLASVVSQRGLKQLHISETEKYAHVTYFLNGGVEKPHKGEEFFNVPSKKVFDYAETPEMSAEIVRDEIVKRLIGIDEEKVSLIVVNFSNPDMLGHTGDLKETIKAVKCVDNCVKDIVKATVKANGVVMVTGDHGNAELMFDKVSKRVNNKHTTNPVPFIYVSSEDEYKVKKDEKILEVGLGFDQNPTGMLADVAPTVLTVLGVEPPSDMTGFNLLDVM